MSPDCPHRHHTDFSYIFNLFLDLLSRLPPVVRQLDRTFRSSDPAQGCVGQIPSPRCSRVALDLFQALVAGDRCDFVGVAADLGQPTRCGFAQAVGGAVRPPCGLGAFLIQLPKLFLPRGAPWTVRTRIPSQWPRLSREHRSRGASEYQPADRSSRGRPELGQPGSARTGRLSRVAWRTKERPASPCPSRYRAFDRGAWPTRASGSCHPRG